MNAIIAVITIKAMENDDADRMDVTVKMDSKCQCEVCNHNHAVLFMGAVLQLVDSAKLDFNEILMAATQINSGGVMH